MGGGAGVESIRGRSRRRARGAGLALTVARRSFGCGGFSAALWAEGAVEKPQSRGRAFAWQAAVRLGARSREWRARTAEAKARPCGRGGLGAVGNRLSLAPEGGAPGCVVRGLGGLPAAAGWVRWSRRRGLVQSSADPLLTRGLAPSEAGGLGCVGHGGCEADGLTNGSLPQSKFSHSRNPRGQRSIKYACPVEGTVWNASVNVRRQTRLCRHRKLGAHIPHPDTIIAYVRVDF